MISSWGILAAHKSVGKQIYPSMLCQRENFIICKKRQNCPRSNSYCEDGFAWGYENKGMARAKFHKLFKLSMENDGFIVEYKDKWENLYLDI